MPRLCSSLFAIHLFASLLATAASAENPATTQRLEILRTAYEAAYAKEVAAAHTTALTDLDAKYTAALDRALAAATQAGQLDTALALRDEKKRLADAAPLPADDFAAPETLKTLRLTYRSALASLELKRDQSAVPVKAKYDAALEALQIELTKAADLDGAVAVKTLREGLKTEVAPKAPAVVVERAKPTVPTPSAAVEKAAKADTEKYDAKTAQQIAEWVFAAGKEVRVLKKGESKYEVIRSAADLPKEDWELISISQGTHTLTKPANFPWELLPKVPTVEELGVNQSATISAAQASFINALPKLKRLDTGNCTISTEALQAMTLNKNMQHLRMGFLEGTVEAAMAAISDNFPSVWYLELNFPVEAALLPDGKKTLPELKELGLKGSLTPEILAKVASIPKLTTFLTNDFRDEAPQPDLLRSLKNLQSLKIRRCKAFAILLPSLKEFAQLKTLELSVSPPDALQPSELELIAQLDQIQRLLLDGGTVAGITEDLVEPLSQMKKLTTLDLLNSRITPKGIESLKKALPTCKITH
ncbi:MAG: hypothetical protein IPK22_09990 [Verrucomicrobiaceae bacterium]|nr:hypothetical protein [Verrucomicrobiaceae bacterium]